MRTVIFAPTGRDGPLIAELLERLSMPCHIARSGAEFCQLLSQGAGSGVLSEEALATGTLERLLDTIAFQQPWSDLPLILLVVGGHVTAESQRLRSLRQPLGNVLLLERPLRPETLLSTLEIALRGRERQYQIRDHMQQYSRAQEALRRSEKLAVTGRLAASIAHEINNPLEAVTNLLYLMHQARDQEEMRSYLSQAEQELARVTEITKQTLRFYREPSQPTDIQLAAVLDSVLLLFHSRLVSAGISVQREVLTPTSTVLSSPGEVRQIVANLVGNAIDAMRTGGRLRVRISSERDPRSPAGSRLRLSIADTGSGIPPHILPSIFEPFVTTKGETGTGLGLWVTGEIIRKNGWSIRVHTTSISDRSGTVFSILIPVQKSEKIRQSA